MGAIYHIAGTGNNISLQYTHYLNARNSDSIAGKNSIGSYFPFVIGPSDSAKATVNLNYNAVDLMLGQNINIGHKLALRAAAGLRYANTNFELKAHYTKLIEQTDSDEYTSNVKQTNDFSGIGPRLALNGNYNLIRGFGIIANVGGSLLISAVDNKFSARIVLRRKSDGSIMRDNTYNFDYKSNNQIIPECDAQLGIDYAHHFNNKFSLIFDAGWKITHYFNIIETVWFDRLFSRNLKSKYLSFSGPFLGVTFIPN